MRYHPDPAVFAKENWSELVQYSAWILSHHGIHLDRPEIVDLLTSWYANRAADVLAAYNPAKGSFESWMRVCLSRELLLGLNRQNRVRMRQALCQSLDEETNSDEGHMTYHELIGKKDPAYEERETLVDLKKFQKYVDSGTVRSPCKQRCIELAATHSRSDIAKELNLSRQRIGQIFNRIRADYHMFLQKRGYI